MLAPQKSLIKTRNTVFILIPPGPLRFQKGSLSLELKIVNFIHFCFAKNKNSPDEKIHDLYCIEYGRKFSSSNNIINTVCLTYI